MSCFFSYNHHKSQANKLMVNYLTYFFLWVTLSGCWYILSERPKSLVNFVLQHRSDSHRISAVFIQMKGWMVCVNLACWFVKDMIFLRMMPLTYFLNVLVGQPNFTSSNSNLARWANYLCMKCSFLPDVSLLRAWARKHFTTGTLCDIRWLCCISFIFDGFCCGGVFQFSHCTVHPTVST